MLMKNAALLLAPYFQLSHASDLLVKLEYPPQVEMGDVSLPCFAFARDLKLSPQKIAEQIAEQINESQTDVHAKAAGGYLNLFYSTPKWKSDIIASATKEGYGLSNI